MGNLAVFLIMALAISATPAATGAEIPARRSRFLVANGAMPVYNCSRKSAAAVCLAPGSPGVTCCGGQCVDTAFNSYHCGGCHHVCRNHHETCCGGRCVDLDSDKRNCGSCGNRCFKKCSYGVCDYA